MSTSNSSPISDSSFDVEEQAQHQQQQQHDDDHERQNLLFSTSHSSQQEQELPEDNNLDELPQESSSSSQQQRLLCRSRSLPTWTTAPHTNPKQQRLLSRNHTSNTHKLLQSSAASNDLGMVSTATTPSDTSSFPNKTNHFTTTSATPRWMMLLWCFCGLQFSYLTWAYLQELLMTTPFQPTPLNPSGLFPSAIFCVFLNRTVALTTATMVLQVRQWRNKHSNNNHQNNPKNMSSQSTDASTTTTTTTQHPSPPLALFGPCAISNALSSVAQYSSLHFVSFPVMTVFKSSTILPVMLLGYCLKGTTYTYAKIGQALVITVGVAVFSLGSSYDEDDDTDANAHISEQPPEETDTTTLLTTTSTPDIPTTSAWGMALLLSYVLLDSFTTTWQDVIYSHHPTLDSFQMMQGVDTIAWVFTSVSLVVSGQLPAVWEFYQTNPHVTLYSLACPIMSTMGQLFIFQTIKVRTRESDMMMRCKGTFLLSHEYFSFIFSRSLGRWYLR